MKNHYKKTQLSFSRELLNILFNKKYVNPHYTNSELDFLVYTVLRNMNEPQQKIYFTKAEIRNQVFNNKINTQNLNRVFNTFNVIKADNDQYVFSYSYDYLYIINKNKKGNVRKRSYKSLDIDKWLMIQAHKGKYTRILALYLTYIGRDFPIKIETLYSRIGFNMSRNKTRSLELIKTSLELFVNIGMIQDYQVTNDKFLIKFTDNYSFNELDSGIKFNKLSSKQKTIVKHNANDALYNTLGLISNKDRPSISLNTDFTLDDNIINDFDIDI